MSTLTSQRTAADVDALVRQWSGLVEHVARKLRSLGLLDQVDPDDVRSEGGEALWRCAALWDVTRVDPTTGKAAAFITYAYVAIRRRLMRLAAQDVRRRAACRPLTEVDLAQLACAANDPPEELPAEVRHTLATLRRREKLVVNLRFGLDGGGTHTLNQIAERMGVSREWVRVLEGRALARLRKAARARPRAAGGRGHGCLLDAATAARLPGLVERFGIRGTARLTGLATQTVRKYAGNSPGRARTATGPGVT